MSGHTYLHGLAASAAPRREFRTRVSPRGAARLSVWSELHLAKAYAAFLGLGVWDPNHAFKIS